jgi:hypothetical protein
LKILWNLQGENKSSWQSWDMPARQRMQNLHAGRGKKNHASPLKARHKIVCGKALRRWSVHQHLACHAPTPAGEKLLNTAGIAAAAVVSFSCTGKRGLARHAGFVDGAKPHALKLHN